MYRQLINDSVTAIHTVRIDLLLLDCTISTYVYEYEYEYAEVIQFKLFLWYE